MGGRPGIRHSRREHIVRNLAALLIWILAGRTTAQTAQGTNPDEGRILSLESAWNQAEQQKDTKALNLLLAENLVYIDYDGTLMDKTQFLASVSVKPLHPSQIVNTSVKAYVYGESAVVTGLYRETGNLQGKTYIRRGRFTDVWVKVNQTWQCVASQSTLTP
jgi:ketosteroid isomerase-like protein